MTLFRSTFEADEDHSPVSTFGAGFLTFLLGLGFLGISALAFQGVAETLLGHALEPGEAFQLLLIRWGLLWFGVCFLSWGLYELVSGKPGPRVLVSLIAVLPVLAPFGFLGYGWDPDAWSVAFTGQRIADTGRYWMSRPPGFPLFEQLASILVPWGGWAFLFAANLCAGVAACGVWMFLPESIPGFKRRRIAVGVLLQPLFLLACGTGLDYIWQTLLISASAVLLVRFLDDSVVPTLWWVVAAGACVGFAAGFRLSSLAVLPIWVALVVAIGDAEGRRAGPAMLLLVGAAIPFLLAEAPVLANYGTSSFRFYPDHPDTRVVMYRLVRLVFNPPTLFLLILCVFKLPGRWSDLRDGERVLLLAGTGVISVFGILFAILPREPGYLTPVIPFLMAFPAFLVPRIAIAACFPAIALWGLVSVPVIPSHPAQAVRMDLRPVAGPLVEELHQRFVQMRRAQRLLMEIAAKKTILIVGFDWATLACLRPDWVVENGVLRNPDAPVEFHDWIAPAEFDRLKNEDARFLVVGNAARFTREKYGYDPLDKGAKPWKE
ncbi:MAG: hypothetical protein GHCLOJNM_03957 [bacterium]|nr:hypothetical protein [bacterium]